MFVLWILCLLQTSVLVLPQFRSTTVKKVDPLTQLRKSLKYVIELLDDIDIRLFNERLRMKQLNLLRSGNIPEYLGNMSAILADLDADPELVKRTNDTTKPTTSTNTKMTFKMKIKSFMKKKNVGYCHAALFAIANIISNAADNNLKKLIEASVNIIVRMSLEGKLASLGDIIVSQGKLVRSWLLSENSVRNKAYKAQQELYNIEKMDHGVLEMLHMYDTFFTANEGENLLDQVKKLYSYNTSSAAVQSLVEGIIEALITPANRKRNSVEHIRFIALINKAYPKRNLISLRSGIGISENIRDSNKMDEPTKLRRVDIKFSKSETKKMPQKSNSNSNLQTQNGETFKYKDRNKNLRKKNINVNRRDQRYQPSDKHKTNDDSEETYNIIDSRDHYHKDRDPKSIKNRNKSRAERPELRKRLKYNTQLDTIQNTKLSTKGTPKVNQQKSSKVKRIHDKPVVRKILSESSYSDEETVLKNQINNLIRTLD